MNVSGAGSSHMVTGKKKKSENGDVVDLVVGIVENLTVDSWRTTEYNSQEFQGGRVSDCTKSV